MIKLTIQTFFSASDPAKLNVPEVAQIGDFSFLYATGLLYVASLVIMVVVPWPTRASEEKSLEGRTYWSIKGEAAEEFRRSWGGWNKLLATIILSVVLGMCLYFSLWSR